MNPRLVQLIALISCAALVFASSTYTSAINQGRKDLDAFGQEEVLESTPPEYAFAIQAFGAFRGILTNIAFIRAEEYKNQGRYYDAMQLASWICKLQPRFPSVWAFHSWNMAWNISVTTYTPEERWNWVYNGAKLLRDEGIRYNPRSIDLYKQLAWIFVNKMSETTDEFHLAYKRNWAWRMHLVLGPPPDPLGDYHPDEQFEFIDAEIGADPLADAAIKAMRRRLEKLRKRVVERGLHYDFTSLAAAEEQMAALGAEEARKLRERADLAPEDRQLTGYEVVRKSAYEAMRRIADSPATLAALYEQFPEARRMVADLRPIGVVIDDDELIEGQYWDRDRGLAFTFFYRYRVLTDPPSLLAELINSDEPDPDAEIRERFAEILGLDQADPAGRALVRFLQKKVLREVYKLDAGKMADLMALFGPMDWRIVDAHSLYWVNEGLIAGDETINQIGNDRTNTARMVFFSLRNLMRRNRMTFEPYTADIAYAYMNFNPDLNFIEPMHQAYLVYGAMLDPEPEAKGVGATFRTGHINFLSEAIRLLWFANRKREAQHYYQYLRTTYGERPDGSLEERYLNSLDQFVVDTVRENVGTYHEERNRIGGLLYASWEELANGNHAQQNMLVETARVAHQAYHKDVPEVERIEKMRLPPFEQMRADTVSAWLTTPAISAENVLLKARLWRVLNPRFSQPLYDAVIGQLTNECNQAGLDAAVAFRAPEGMDEFREEYRGRARERSETDVETPAQND